MAMSGRWLRPEEGVVTGGLGIAAMHVIRESDNVMLAASCGRAEG